ncbi:hypothetical protein SPRG_21232 [Saprolegnia parasitica CBS 223.65]|uniref:Uncharacterized protein n=1 Tax=Saprolegnia parasitica (strain CBS 223.65) TaxID=695850 RepID=A0A067BTN8_SAPPC|nr:hypothetical protein SPRG_21232 [Saprolegnia parasitica CBS 223.65]KDO21899.1 hypothetical protein SPRG_21232 [Saprolegnia parasitica CBS 223.65]|eukprot:XP_012207386.1 hypothetical protein SPRG_21232 [Saprolegnia parasitica CBS 223.65]
MDSTHRWLTRFWPRSCTTLHLWRLLNSRPTTTTKMTKMTMLTSPRLKTKSLRARRTHGVRSPPTLLRHLLVAASTWFSVTARHWTTTSLSARRSRSSFG